MPNAVNSADAKKMLAAYYGLITHIDNQLSRFNSRWEFDLLENTILQLVTTKGSAGEHYLFRKGYHLGN